MPEIQEYQAQPALWPLQQAVAWIETRSDPQSQPAIVDQITSASVQRLHEALKAGIEASGCVDGGERRAISPAEWHDYRLTLEMVLFADVGYVAIIKVLSVRLLPAGALKDHGYKSEVRIPSAQSPEGEASYHRVITDVLLRSEQVQQQWPAIDMGEKAPFDGVPEQPVDGVPEQPLLFDQPPQRTNQRHRSAKKFDQVKGAVWRDIQQGRQTADSLSAPEQSFSPAGSGVGGLSSDEGTTPDVSSIGRRASPTAPQAEPPPPVPAEPPAAPLARNLPASPEQRLILETAAEVYTGGWTYVATRNIIKAVGDKIKAKKLEVPKRDVFLRALGRRK